MWKRIVAATKVLWGIRPAEAQFDGLDRWIASDCAFTATEAILCQLLKDTALPLREDIFGERVEHLIFAAIRLYATHEGVEGPRCRRELEDVARARKKYLRDERRAKASGRDDDIPF